ncbi:MAG: SAM-dependent methyltransferase [Bacteroidetes bacterium]|nr:MAG: SAM-dependent methyltransferase [Bacteroidota bacterium]
MSTKGTLYLIPNFLGEPAESPLLVPDAQLAVIRTLTEFIVENEKNARACLKGLQISTPQNQLTIHVLDKHNPQHSINTYLKNAEGGGSIGLLSDAGVPCVADPGAEVVKVAHKKGIQVVPFVGPSSILLAIMASGFNGQSFAFHGYLPIDTAERAKKLKFLEKESRERKQTQVFIETPYRNNPLLADIMKHCSPQTMLCVACNLTLPDESIVSQSIDKWLKNTPDYHKKPAVFVLFGG